MRLGIDFGTCYSSAALLLDNTLKPIKEPLKHGYSFPSSIFLTPEGEMLVGFAAENRRLKDIQRYKNEFKRVLGSMDPIILGDRQLQPDELVTEVIVKLKTEADKVVTGRGEQSLSQAILTVPATYLSNKRQLMLQACDRAGFSQVQLLEEPVAAAIYYSNTAKIAEGDIVLVYDLGGGTFDVTLLQKQNSGYQIRGMPDGDPNCGGVDFDRFIFRELVKNCSEELRQKLIPKECRRERAFVFPMCRNLKHQLSEASEAEISIPLTMESFSLTRERFNELIDDLVSNTVACCDRLISSAELEWSQINRVLLVGGSCRIPYVREVIARKWGKTPSQIDDPELAVCLGAAIYGAELDVETPESYLQKGLAKIQAGDYQSAIAEFDQAIDLDSNYAPAYCHRGMARAQLNEDQAALEDYDLAIRLDRNYGEAYLHRGNLRCQSNDLKGAIEDYDRALFVNPDLTEAAEKKELVFDQLISIPQSQVPNSTVLVDETVKADRQEVNFESDENQQTIRDNSASELEVREPELELKEKAQLFSEVEIETSHRNEYSLANQSQEIHHNQESTKNLINSSNLVLTVSQQGDGNYKSISEAIDNAIPNSQIRVLSGIYQEHLIIDKPLEIIGDVASGSVIVQNSETACVVMYANYATLRHLTLQRLVGQNQSESPAVDVSQGQLVLEDCDITSASLSCIYIHGPNANPIIRNCQIHEGKQNGILIDEKGKGIIDKCNIFKNERFGIEIKQQSNPTISNSQIKEGKNCGIVVGYQGKGCIDSCHIFTNVFSGIEIYKEGNPTLRNCKINDNKKAGINVCQKGGGLVENCNIFNNYLSGVLIKEDANPTLCNCKINDNKKAGINVCQKGKGIIENCNIFSNCLSGVLIKEDANPTLHNCKIHDRNLIGITALESVIPGINVYQKGKGIIENCDIFANLSGIEICNEGRPTLRNCQIYANGQIGINVYQKGEGLVEDCNIFNNPVSGIQIRKEGDLTLRNCRIYDGDQVGIAVFDQGKGLIENCDIFANGCSGIEIKKEGNPIIRNCKIRDGKDRGIFVWRRGQGKIENSEIFTNAGTGVEINLQGNLVLCNCQIHDGKGYGILLCNNGQATIENCQVYDNALEAQTQVWKCVRTITGHGGFWGIYAGVSSVAFSPDGKTLASGSDDETIKLWQVETGRVILTIQGHNTWVKSVAFSPDGQLIASGSQYNLIRLWRVKDGCEIRNFSPANYIGSISSLAFSPSNYIDSIYSSIYSLAFSPDGKLLASGSDDHTIRIWQVSNGKEIQTLNKHTNYVRTVAFSLDGQLLASGSYDNTVKLWNTTNGEEICTFKGHSSGVNSVVFSPDGNLLASGSNDGTVKLWQVSTQEEICSCSTASGGVRSVAFSSDGQILAGGTTENAIALWQVSTGRHICNLLGHTNNVNSIAFHPDGTMLTSGSDDHTIKLWQRE